MAELATQQIVDTGLEASYASAAGAGDTFVNDGSGRQFIHVFDASDGVTVTVTPEVATTEKPGFSTLTQPPMVVAVGAAEDRMIGPFPFTAFGVNPAITYDSETGVTIAVIKL